MTIKVLLIEDEKNLADMIAFFLEEEGYITERVHHAREALQLFPQFQPDIVVTDLMLPEMDGNDLVEAFRQHSTVPILMISASTMLNDRLRALHNGADDFLCKPFSLKELDARIKALLRRSIISYQDKPVKEDKQAEVTGHVNVNEYRRTLFVDGVEIEVTHIEFEIMKELYRNPGKVFTRNELMGSDQKAPNAPILIVPLMFISQVYVKKLSLTPRTHVILKRFGEQAINM